MQRWNGLPARRSLLRLALALAATGRRAARASPPVPPAPPPGDAIAPPPLGPRQVWVAGRWSWNGMRYVWIPAHIAPRGPGGHRWVPGHWVRGRSGARPFWRPGHWR